MRGALESMWTVGAPGTEATAGAASATTVIPVAANGIAARRLLVAVKTATEFAVIRPVQSGGTVTVDNGIPVSRDMGYVVLNVVGFSHIAHIRGGAVDVEINLIPLEE